MDQYKKMILGIFLILLVMPLVMAPKPFCGDGRCKGREDSLNCPEDCGCVPFPETCNNLDDNCNSLIDEDLFRECGVSDVGACEYGSQTCSAGSWGTCVGNIDPKPEVCEGSIDENCNGQVDEGCECVTGQTQQCGVDVGACEFGLQTCSGGVWGACVGETGPTIETCNGIDDNCNGPVDESLTRVCGDSDVGACRKGVETCSAGVWGGCVGEVTPVPEVCNGVDDNCNSIVDDGFDQDDCIENCLFNWVGNGGSLNCCGDDVGEDSPFEAVETSIDGRDNDCDGEVDEQVSLITILFDDFETNFTAPGWYDDGIVEAWKRDSSGTPSGSTGPTAGAEGTTWYIYVETSGADCNIARETAIVYQTPEIDFDAYTGEEIRWWNNMYGSTIGTLSLQEDTTGSWVELWSMSGNQGTDWFETSVDLSGLTGTGNLRFYYTCAGGFTGDAAIDEISIEAIDTETCTNECSTSGNKVCDGNGYKTCGNYDVDDCLEWSSVTNCLTEETCVDGVCVGGTTDYTDRTCNVDGSAGFDSIECGLGDVNMNEGLSNATFDSCEDGTNDGFMWIENITVDATTVLTTDTVQVTCEVNCYSATTKYAIAYNNGSGWVNKDYGTCTAAGIESKPINVDIDDVVGTHYFRCIERWGTSFTGAETCDSSTYSDNDDMSINVIESGGELTTILFDDFETNFTAPGWYDDGILYAWAIDSLGTSSSSTGPCGGTGSCAGNAGAPNSAGVNTTWYIYVETSAGSCNLAGDTAIVYQTPEINFNSYTGEYMTWWNSMYGANIGTLKLEENTTGTWKELWSLSSDQGIDWFESSVDLSSLTGTGNLRFYYTCAGGFWGDAAIDEISIEAIDSETCDDECSVSGQKVCDGNGYKTCGDYDMDSCLEWSGVTNCLAEEICVDGNCIALSLYEGLISWWKMDEVVGNQIIDSKGLHNGTLMNDSYIGDDSGRGKVLKLDGSYDYVDIGAFNETENLNEFSVSVWVKAAVADATRSRWVFNKPYNIGMERSSQEVYYLGAYNDTERASGATVIYPEDTNWHHIVGVYNGANVFVYIDNKSRSYFTISSRLTGDTRESDDNFSISYPSSYSAFNGSIDDFMFYNRALSEDEVYDLYTSQCTNECSVSGQKVCEENRLKTCGDYDDDSCLEWSSLISCLPGKICENDNCIAMTTEEQKDMLKYSDKEVFLISDKNWKEVLPLVPVTTWTGGENCKRGTQTNVCTYPSLIYHEEDFGTSKTLELNKNNFMKQTKLSVNWNLKDNLLSEGNVEGDEFDILFDLSEDEYYNLVNGNPLVRLDLTASKIDPFAGDEINYEIFLNGQELDKTIYKQPGGYIITSLIRTDYEKQLLEIGQNSLTFRRTGGNMLIEGYKLNTFYFTYEYIDDYCKSENFYDLCISDVQLDKATANPGDIVTYSITVKNICDEPIDLSGQETLFTMYPTIPHNLVFSHQSTTVPQVKLDPGQTTQFEIKILYNESKSNIFPDSAFDADSIIYFMQQYSQNRVTIIGESPQELDNLLIAEPPLGVGLEENQIQRISPDNYLAYWTNPNNIVYVEDNYELALLASTYASLINAPLVIEGTVLDKQETFSGKNVICVGDVAPIGSSCTESYDLNSLQNKYVEKTKTNKIILVNPDDLKIYNLEELNPLKSSNSIFKLYSKTSLSSPFLAAAKNELIIGDNSGNYSSADNSLKSRIAESGIIVNEEIYDDVYLTVVSSTGIPNKLEAPLKGGHYQYKALDQVEYSDFNSDSLPDINTGRIQGISTSDVSNYIARVVFYDDIESDKNIKFLTSTFRDWVTQANCFAEIFNEAGYTAVSVGTEEDYYDFNPNEWEDQSLIYYMDHGSSRWGGIYSDSIPVLNNSVTIQYACSTCSTFSGLSFCNRAIRQGSIMYVGAVSVAWTGNDIYERNLNGIYYENKSIGKSFKKAYNSDYRDATWMTTLLGDPTLNINLPYKLNSELIYCYPEY